MKLIVENLQLRRWDEINFFLRKRYKIDKVQSGEFQKGINIFEAGVYGDSFLKELAKGRWRRNSRKEKIYFNKKEISLKELQKIVCYIGHGEERFPYNILNVRVKQHIQKALMKSGIGYSYDDIIHMFQLKEPFLNWDVHNAIGYGWIYLFAIHFARGKKIFCFTPCSYDLMLQQDDFSIIEKVAEKQNLIILISTDVENGFVQGVTEFDYKTVKLQ